MTLGCRYTIGATASRSRRPLRRPSCPGGIDTHALAVGMSDRGRRPAGLTAAIYLARYRRRVLLADAANSRAEAIPKSHNHPGFAGGVSGRELLARLRQQARRYEVEIMNVKIEKLEKSNGHFVAKGAGAPLEADRVLWQPE
jgi:alkyl hydroperoxide reductase subunit AhpF